MRPNAFGGFASASAAFVLASCGLVTSDPTPTGAAGAAGMGGSAGQPPLPVVCNAFQRAGDPITLTPGGSDPSLANAGAALDLVFDTGQELRTARWQDPWQGTFELPEISTVAVTQGGNAGFVLASDTSDTASNAPVVLHGGDWNTVTAPCLQLTRFGQSPEPLGEIGDCSTNTAGLSANAVIPGAPGSGAYLLAYGPSGAMQLGLLRADGSLAEADYVACSTLGVRAVGWATPSSGFVVALASGSPFGGCGGTGDIGPSTRLQIVTVDAGSVPLAPLLKDELVVPHPIMDLDLARRPDGGAWLVATLRDSEEQASLYALGLDGNGKVDTALVPLVKPAGWAVAAVASFGERMALAWHAHDGALRVTLLDETMNASTPPLHEEPASATTISLASTPSHDALVAAWQDGAGSIRAARFDCIP